MTLPFRSFYARLSLVYLGLLLLFCVACVWIMAQCLTLFWLEAGQRANRELARNVSHELAPLLRQDLPSPALRQAVARLNALHLSRDVYLLDGRGRMLIAFSETNEPVLDSISLEPVSALLQGEARLPIRGADPIDPPHEKIFSAAPVELAGGAPGYLYIILLGKRMDLAFSAIWESFFLRLLVLLLLATLLATAAFGAVLFRLLTRRFRRLTHAVQRMKEGEYGERLVDDAHDEIGQLVRTFNEMAVTIEAQLQALEQNDALRRTLVADVSHDLRTPLTSTRGYAERMLEGRDRLSEEEQRQCLVAILNNTVQIERLAGQLTMLSRLDVDRTPPNIESFPIAELAQDVVLVFKPEAEAGGIDLQVVDGPDLPRVDADISLIERALSNLLENALHNTPAGGTVRLELEEMADSIEVRVTDTGRGITPEELPLVSRRFYRTEHSRAQALRGSGLGLSIAREIAELHGSNLEIRSAVGEGTTVSFRLPTAGSRTS